MGPWNECIDGIYSSLFGRTAVTEIAEAIDKYATAEFIDELENRSLAHRIDLTRALSSYLLDAGTVEELVVALEDAVQNRDKSWAVARCLPYAQALRGLDSGDASEVEAGIEGLIQFHYDHVASARDADVIQRTVALDAAAMLALARREGVAISADHEAIPDVLNDDQHYPVGE